MEVPPPSLVIVRHLLDPRPLPRPLTSGDVVFEWPLDSPKSCMSKPFARMIYTFFISKIDAWVQLEISAKNIKQLGHSGTLAVAHWGSVSLDFHNTWAVR